jgi:mRNA interferase MazF
MPRAWTLMTGLKRGDVVLVLFPNSDLITFKKRPALIVEADALNTGLPQIVIVMITSNLARRGHASRVFVPLNSPAWRGSGLLTDSVIMTDNLATALNKAVLGKLGHLADMKPIDAALRTTLAL